MSKPAHAQKVENQIFNKVFFPILQEFYSFTLPIHIVRGPGRGVVQSPESGLYELEYENIRSVSPMGALYLMHFVPERDIEDDYALLKHVAKFRPSAFPEEGMRALKRGLNLEPVRTPGVWYAVGADLWYRIDAVQTVLMRKHRKHLAQHRSSPC